mgnify:FL=1
MNSRCCLGLMTKKHKVPHKSVWIARKVPHKNVINFAITLFFSLLQQEYNIWKDLLCMTLYIMDEVQKLYCGLALSETYI